MTDAGQELLDIVVKLGEWGQRWVNHDFAEEEVSDASLLMWDMRRRVNWDAVPDNRVTVQFSISGSRHPHYWLVLDRGGADVCLQDPGYDVDLHVESDTRSLHLWWMGRLPYANGVRQGLIRLEGPRQLVRDFPSWLACSTFARIEPA